MLTFRLLKAPRYLEMPASPRRSVIVAGVGRSGTTWLGNVISQMIQARVIFEPCLTDKNGLFLINRSRSGLVNLAERYERPVDLWNKADFDQQIKTVERMLFGCIQGGWVDQDIIPGIFNRRVIKMIRVNLFIGHIARAWPQIKIVYVIRSPHKVIESMLNQEEKGWKFDWARDDIINLSNRCLERGIVTESFDWDGESLLDRLTMRWCVELH